MTINIKKAKLKESKLTVTIEGTDDHGLKYKSPGQEYDTPVHPDMNKAFDKLNIHFAVMVHYVKPHEIPDMGDYPVHLADGFTVTQYSLGGKEDNPGVTLTGFYHMSNGKAFNYNTPFYRFDDQSPNAYAFMDHLKATIEEIEKEIRAYIAGTKKADDNQLSMFDKNDQPITHMQVAEPENKVFVGKNEADPEAMQRVKDWNHQEGTQEAQGSTIFTKQDDDEHNALIAAYKADTAPKTTKKRVAQSSVNPSGILEEESPI